MASSARLDGVPHAGDDHGVHDALDRVLIELPEGRRGGTRAVDDRVEPRGDVRLDERRGRLGRQGDGHGTRRYDRQARCHRPLAADRLRSPCACGATDCGCARREDDRRLRGAPGRPVPANRRAGRGTAIATCGLTKRYGGARGIEDLTFSVTTGEVFGFLGPNGAGKTTTIRTLLGLLRPTAGTARILGHDVARRRRRARARTGSCRASSPSTSRSPARSCWTSSPTSAASATAPSRSLAGDSRPTCGARSASSRAGTDRRSASSRRSCTAASS